MLNVLNVTVLPPPPKHAQSLHLLTKTMSLEQNVTLEV